MKVTKYCPPTCDFASTWHTSVCTSLRAYFLLIRDLGRKAAYSIFQPRSQDICPNALSSSPVGVLILLASAFLFGSCDTTFYATALPLCRLPHLLGPNSNMHATHIEYSSFGHGPQLGFPCKISTF